MKEPPRDGHNNLVVDRHREEDTSDEEHRQGRRGDLKRVSDAAVHGGGLGDRERRHLSINGPERNRGGPDRQHPDDQLHLLHVRHGRHVPLALQRVTLTRSLDRRFVQKAAWVMHTNT